MAVPSGNEMLALCLDDDDEGERERMEKGGSISRSFLRRTICLYSNVHLVLGGVRDCVGAEFNVGAVVNC